MKRRLGSFKKVVSFLLIFNLILSSLALASEIDEFNSYKWENLKKEETIEIDYSGDANWEEYGLEFLGNKDGKVTLRVNENLSSLNISLKNGELKLNKELAQGESVQNGSPSERDGNEKESGIDDVSLGLQQWDKKYALRISSSKIKKYEKIKAVIDLKGSGKSAEDVQVNTLEASGEGIKTTGLSKDSIEIAVEDGNLVVILTNPNKNGIIDIVYDTIGNTSGPMSFKVYGMDINGKEVYIESEIEDSEDDLNKNEGSGDNAGTNGNNDEGSEKGKGTDLNNEKPAVTDIDSKDKDESSKDDVHKKEGSEDKGNDSNNDENPVTPEIDSEDKDENSDNDVNTNEGSEDGKDIDKNESTEEVNDNSGEDRPKDDAHKKEGPEDKGNDSDNDENPATTDVDSRGGKDTDNTNGELETDPKEVNDNLGEDMPEDDGNNEGSEDGKGIDSNNDQNSVTPEIDSEDKDENSENDVNTNEGSEEGKDIDKNESTEEVKDDSGEGRPEADGNNEGSEDGKGIDSDNDENPDTPDVDSGGGKDTDNIIGELETDPKEVNDNLGKDRPEDDGNNEGSEDGKGIDSNNDENPVTPEIDSEDKDENSDNDVNTNEGSEDGKDIDKNESTEEVNDDSGEDRPKDDVHKKEGPEYKGNDSDNDKNPATTDVDSEKGEGKEFKLEDSTEVHGSVASLYFEVTSDEYKGSTTDVDDRSLEAKEEENSSKKVIGLKDDGNENEDCELGDEVSLSLEIGLLEIAESDNINVKGIDNNIEIMDERYSSDYCELEVQKNTEEVILGDYQSASNLSKKSDIYEIAEEIDEEDNHLDREEVPVLPKTGGKSFYLYLGLFFITIGLVIKFDYKSQS